jgi:hypothetical protein
MTNVVTIENITERPTMKSKFTSGAETDYHSGATEFTSGFSGVCVAESY